MISSIPGWIFSLIGASLSLLSMLIVCPIRLWVMLPFIAKLAFSALSSVSKTSNIITVFLCSGGGRGVTPGLGTVLDNDSNHPYVASQIYRGVVVLAIDFDCVSVHFMDDIVFVTSFARLLCARPGVKNFLYYRCDFSLV